MLRHRLTHWSLPLGVVLGMSLGCARELELEPAPDPSAVVVAQFDPTNPIRVLQLIPSPTALAENPDGTINQAAVRPEPCQLPTRSQCLAFVDGWPVNTPVTLFFSGDLDESTIEAGIKIYEVGDAGLVEVPYTFTTAAKDPVNPACQQGENGSNPPRTFTQNDLPGGIKLELTPTRLLRFRTRHMVMVTSHEGGGLRSADGKVVEPAALFSILNVPPENAPVTADGTIASALLRSQVQGTVLRTLFPDKASVADLTAEQQAAWDAGVKASGQRLVGLYQFFGSVTGALLQSGRLEDRAHAVFVDTWTTGGAPPPGQEVGPGRVDPPRNAEPRRPFPNVPLMTVVDPNDPTDVRVNLEITDADSPSARALKTGLNTLNGFSTTMPMTVTASRDLDPASLDGRIVMYPVNDQNMVNGAAVPLAITTSSAAGGRPFTITMRPLLPLQQDQNYVVAITRGVKDAAGNDVTPAQTFDFLKIPAPFIDGQGEVLSAIVPALQCSTVQTAGRLATDTEVQGLATQLEQRLQHQRWLPAFAALESLSPAIPRTEVLLAWNYKTQDITRLVEQVKDQLLPGVWDNMMPARPRLVGPVLELTGTQQIAQAVGVVENLCVAVCETGGTAPIPPAECAVRENGRVVSVHENLPGHPICSFAVGIVAGRLATARMYLMKGYRATVGNPYVAGTFTPQTIAMPAVVDLPIWVIEGQGDAPQGGRPIAIFQHGLGQVKESGFYMANSLATVNASGGWATVLMDLPFHGARASDLTRATPAGEVPCTNEQGLPDIDPANVVCNPQTGECTGGCDGVRDSSGTGFLSSNVFGARDNFRQSTIDQLTLLMTLQAEARPGGLLEGLDPTRIGYIGQSLGGITGGNLAAVGEDLVAAVLNVPGANLTTILLNTVPQISAPLFASLVAAGVCELNVPNNPTSGCRNTPAFRQFILTAQWALDPGDPHATSVAVDGALGLENVLIQMALPDPVVPNIATRIMAGAYGLPATSPPPGAGRFQVYDFSALPQATQGSGCHGWLLAPTCGLCLQDNLCKTIGAQQQAATFLETGGQTVLPQVPDAVAIYNCANPCD